MWLCPSAGCLFPVPSGSFRNNSTTHRTRPTTGGLRPQRYDSTPMSYSNSQGHPGPLSPRPDDLRHPTMSLDHSQETHHPLPASCSSPAHPTAPSYIPLPAPVPYPSYQRSQAHTPPIHPHSPIYPIHPFSNPYVYPHPQIPAVLTPVPPLIVPVYPPLAPIVVPPFSYPSIHYPQPAAGVLNPQLFPTFVQPPVVHSHLSSPNLLPHASSIESHRPATRSEFTMWIGNVPADATESELWRVLSPPYLSTPHPGSGLVSVHLITKSHCAFANYDSQYALDTALTYFSGRRYRPEDPTCPQMVCRVRTTTDDVKSGVGLQRGTGMHVAWARMEKDREVAFQKRNGSPIQDSDGAPSRSSTISSSSHPSGGSYLRIPSEPDEDSDPHSSSSSFLKENFPSRYFILKSLTRVSIL
jgi:hypothetical protein